MPDHPTKTPQAAAIAQLRRQYTRIQAAGGPRSRDFWAGALMALDELERLTAIPDTLTLPDRPAEGETVG